MFETNGNGVINEFIDLGEISLNEDSAQFQALANSFLGLGNRTYDSSAEDMIASVVQLSDLDVINLCRSSSIARRITEIYPSECAFGIPALPKQGYYGITPDKILTYINDSFRANRSKTLEGAFRQASKQALKYGVSYIVLGFNDGSVSMAEQLNQDNLISFNWVEVLDKDQLIADNLYQPNYYQFLNVFDQGRQNERELEAFIHSSRVLRFTSKNYDRLELRGQSKFDSILQSTVADLLVTMKGNRVSNQLLLKKALIYAKVSTSAGTIQANRDKLQERLGYINLLSSVFRMIGLGDNEDLGAVQIDLSNVDNVLEKNIEALVASSGIVRTNLLGQPAQSGLGQATNGLENRIEHSRRCNQWSVEHWKEKLIQVYNLVCLCQQSPTKGRSLKGLSVDFSTTLTLFPQEWAELRKQNAEWAKTHSELGTLNLNEIRQAFFGSAELIGQMIPNITLDEGYDPDAAKAEKENKQREILLSKTQPNEQKQLEESEQEKPTEKTQTDGISLTELEKQLEAFETLNQDDIDQTLGGI